MKFSHEIGPDYLIISIEGLFICDESLSRLNVFVQSQIVNGIKNIIIDMDKMEFISSTVIGFLVRISSELNRNLGRFVLCNVNKEAVLKTFEITKVDTIIKIFNSRQEAINHISN